MITERTPRDWFQEAARCYVEHHQGCAFCRGVHRVYQLVEDQQVVYYCYDCDFRTGFDRKTGQFFSYAGDPDATKGGGETMTGL
jgi:hypothetical protein